MHIYTNEKHNKEYFPKILVIGEGFRDLSGPGITLTSMFLGWPQDRIADIHISTERNDTVTNEHYTMPHNDGKSYIQTLKEAIRNGQIAILKTIFKFAWNVVCRMFFLPTNANLTQHPN